MERHLKNNKATTFHSNPSEGWEHWNPEDKHSFLVVVFIISSLFRSL